MTLRPRRLRGAAGSRARSWLRIPRLSRLALSALAVLSTAAAARALPGADSPAGEGPASARYQRAEEAYNAGRYDEAGALYEGLLAEGFDDARIHYNLGNVRYRQDRLGGAILCWQRALAVDPHDADARENLALAEQQIPDKTQEPDADDPATAIVGWVHAVRPSRSLPVLAIAVSLTSILALPLWGDPPVRAKAALRMALRVVAPLCLLAALAVVVGVTRPGERVRVVVQVESLDGRSAPAADGTVLFTVHEGLTVEVREERPGWIQIVLPNGLSGWVEANGAERI